MHEGLDALTEREKEALRLMLRGHDAKSMADALDLSVHTVNERLRHARRKLAVSSSRAAARKLAEAEAGHPQNLVDEQLRDAPSTEEMAPTNAPLDQPGSKRRFAWQKGAFVIMTILLATLAASALMQANMPTATPGDRAPSAAAASDAVDAALGWLALVDRGDWDASWNATGQAFKNLNTSAKWAGVSEQVRVPLGAVTSRKLVSREEVPAPPYGYIMVRFHTDFANRPDTTETLSLVNEGGSWKVVGYVIG